MRHRLKGRVYDRSGRHCDRCETDIKAGSSGKWCKVALQLVVSQLYIYIYITLPCQFCDFDLCQACCEATPTSPAARHSPFESGGAPPTPSAAVRSPIAVAPSNHARIVSGMPGTVERIQVPSTSPVASKIHPFFVKRPIGAVDETHEMRFRAAARHQDPVAVDKAPHVRQEGRLRRKVFSTPLQTSTTVCMPPRLKAPTRHPLSDAELSDVAALTISTPPRIEFALDPRTLFPDLLSSSSSYDVPGTPTFPSIVKSVTVASIEIQCRPETRESACQTYPQLERDGIVQTSPRLLEPVTLLDLKREMQALLSGICWL